MKRELIQFGIEVAAILLIGFGALALFDGCTTPTEPQFHSDVVFVPQLTIEGQPILDTIGWDGFYIEPEHELEKYPVTRVRGSWIPRESRLAQCRPGDGKINDTMRDTSER